MTPREVDCSRCEIYSCDIDAALQEFQAVVAHPATNLQQFFSAKNGGLGLNSLHDPRKLVRVHPGSDVLVECRAAYFNIRIRNVLKTQRVRLPVIAYAFYYCIHEMSLLRFRPGEFDSITRTITEHQSRFDRICEGRQKFMRKVATLLLVLTSLTLGSLLMEGIVRVLDVLPRPLAAPPVTESLSG